MKQIRLGQTGPVVSAVGLGCMGMSDFYGPADADESTATLRAALDAGVTLLDTGDFYGMGHNEMLIAATLRDVPRERYLLSVKFGALRGPDGQFLGFDLRPDCDQDCAGLFAQATRHRLHRHLPSLAPRSGGADRGRDRRAGRAREGRLCPPHRPVGSRRRDHPPRPRNAPDLRSSDRVLAHEPRRRGGHPAGAARTRDRR